MSAFAAKRKARKIQVHNDEDPITGPGDSEPTQAGSEDAAQPQLALKFGKRPNKQSSLRKAINFDDDHDADRGQGPADDDGDGDGDGPVVVRPSIGRAGSTKQKKKSSSRLSFGPGQGVEDGEGDGEAVAQKQASLGQRALESSAFRKSASLQRLPGVRPVEDEDRPRYSKEYLSELQNSTPNTPPRPPQQDIAGLRIADDDDDDDEMALDSSELEGAVIVRSTDVAAPSATTRPGPTIMTESEIRERKERRARLAREHDFMSLDGGDDDGSGGGGGSYISLMPKKKEPEKRIIAEDEDLGEGYDEFVEDGGLSLGRKAEKEAHRRHRQEMVDLINAAEGDGPEGDDSDDSEAERRAAYEAAQTRAGMDGLHRDEDGGLNDGVAGDVLPRMKPLPDLAECLGRMQGLVAGMAGEVARKRSRIAELEKEKEEIMAREKEVQGVLDLAGKRYREVSGVDAAKVATESPLRVAHGLGAESDMPAQRGLESFGATPVARPDAEDMA